MFGKPLLLLSLILFVNSAVAQEFSVDELIGTWVFQSYAEIDTPDERVAVGVQMEFRSDGTVISKLSKGEKEESYSVDGDSITYVGERGDQVWKVQSFEPDKSMVVEHMHTFMYFERI